ncbi:MAG: hypothetical protein LBV75_01760 [Paludibacter sp.]|jgi:Spy/CpxP family protein refolding chaperone|nr:hypothetical protein [Paludibacter sp.]
MKKYLFLSIVAIFAISMSVMAQEGNQRRAGGGRGLNVSPQERVDQLAKQVELTDEQKAQVLTFYEKVQKRNQEQFETMRKAREAGQQQTGDFRARYEEQQKADDAELETIIGKEKLEKVKAAREEQRRQVQPQRPQRN